MDASLRPSIHFHFLPLIHFNVPLSYRQIPSTSPLASFIHFLSSLTQHPCYLFPPQIYSTKPRLINNKASMLSLPVTPYLTFTIFSLRLLYRLICVTHTHIYKHVLHRPPNSTTIAIYRTTPSPSSLPFFLPFYSQVLLTHYPPSYFKLIS